MTLLVAFAIIYLLWLITKNIVWPLLVLSAFIGLVTHVWPFLSLAAMIAALYVLTGERNVRTKN